MVTAAPFTEVQLDAAALTLLGQPRLWQALAHGSNAVDEATGPWTTYWSTRRTGSLPACEARQHFAAAFDGFDAAGQRVGVLLSLAALIETFYVEEGALQPMDPWVARLAERLPDDGDWPTAELEAQVMACGLAITLRDQTHPLLARWAGRGAVLLRRLAPGAVRMKLATFLLQYHLWRGEFGHTALIVEALPGIDTAGLLPAEALIWHESVATHARFTGQHARGRAEVQAALMLSRRHHLQQHDYALHAHGAALELAAGDADAAQAHVQAMRPLLARQPPDDQTHYWHLQAGMALLRGDATQAATLARTALDNSLEIGGPYRTAVHQLSLAQCLLAQRDAPRAMPLLDEAVATADSIDAGLLAYSARLVRSSGHALLDNTTAADTDLRVALAAGAAGDYRAMSGWWLPTIVAERMHRALQLEIEPAYVRRWVRDRALPCPDPNTLHWPWPLSVRGFGELQILRHDEPLPAAPGRAAQRPLDLLRALLAHAPAPLPVSTAVQWLWPDAAGADERKPFDVALLRLRRLLGDESLLRLEGGRLCLAPEFVWTDVHALARLTQTIDETEVAPREQLDRWAQILPSLVGGPLLAGVETGWAQAARDRQRQRFVLAVDSLAARLSAHDTDASRRLLERAMDADPAAEAIARRLMQLHVQHDRPTEAQRVLSLNAAMVQLVNGLPLSPETRRVAAELGLLTP